MSAQTEPRDLLVREEAGPSCLGFVWLFFAAAASLALTGSGSLEGICEFYVG